MGVASSHRLPNTIYRNHSNMRGRSTWSERTHYKYTIHMYVRILGMRPWCGAPCYIVQARRNKSIDPIYKQLFMLGLRPSDCNDFSIWFTFLRWQRPGFEVRYTKWQCLLILNYDFIQIIAWVRASVCVCVLCMGLCASRWWMSAWALHYDVWPMTRWKPASARCSRIFNSKII